MLLSFVLIVHFFIHSLICLINKHGQTQAMCWREKITLLPSRSLKLRVHSLLLKRKRNTYPFLCHERQKAHYIEHKQKWWNKPVSIVLVATAAKLLQLCPTLCDPIDGSPLDSSVREIFQARVLEWVAISFSILSLSISLLENNSVLPTISLPSVFSY